MASSFTKLIVELLDGETKKRRLLLTLSNYRKAENVLMKEVVLKTKNTFLPILINVHETHWLIIGATEKATESITNILQYNSNCFITVIAPVIPETIKALIQNHIFNKKSQTPYGIWDRFLLVVRLNMRFNFLYKISFWLGTY